MRSQISIRKTSNSIKTLIEYVKACDKFDPKQPNTFKSIQNLSEMNVKKSYLNQLIDELKHQMNENSRIFMVGIDIDQLKRDNDSLIEEYYNNTFKDKGVDGLRSMDNRSLEHLLKDKERDNVELYQYVV